MKYRIGEVVRYVGDINEEIKNQIGTIVSYNGFSSYLVEQYGTEDTYWCHQDNLIRCSTENHYSLFEEVEAIHVIASSMTQEEFRGFCMGNVLKYRLRAGKKDEVEKELNKANHYLNLYKKHKHLCRSTDKPLSE